MKGMCGLIPNVAVRNLIREDKLHQIYSQMQIGQGKHGMLTLNQSLASLYLRRIITLDDAMGATNDSEELKHIIQTGGAVPPAMRASKSD
jgi:twitching motility protein PilT